MLKHGVGIENGGFYMSPSIFRNLVNFSGGPQNKRILNQNHLVFSNLVDSGPQKKRILDPDNFVVIWMLSDFGTKSNFS